jgi:alkylhydroperoxidase family enzyme
MSFIETIPEASAEGAVAQMYERIRGSGELPNWARVFSRKPEVFAGWQGLIDAVKSGQDSRHFELATIGAARALSSSYCLLAHGKRLMQDGVGPDVLREIGETGPFGGRARHRRFRREGGARGQRHHRRRH